MGGEVGEVVGGHFVYILLKIGVIVVDGVKDVVSIYTAGKSYSVESCGGVAPSVPVIGQCCNWEAVVTPSILIYNSLHVKDRNHMLLIKCYLF